MMFSMQVILQNILPYLPDRMDWNNLSAASKSIYKTYKEETSQKGNDVIPPWPRGCEWPKDLSLPEDEMPPGMPRSFGNYTMGNLDSYNPVWSRDGTQIVSSSNGHFMSRRRMIIHVIDQRIGHVKRWGGHGKAVITSLDFGDNFLISSAYDRRVKKWDCNNNFECIGDWDHLIPDENQYVDHLQQAPFRLKVSPDSQTVVMVLKGSICIFDPSDGTIRHSIPIGENIYGTSTPIFTPDGNTIIFGCGNSYGEEEEEPRSDGYLKAYSFTNGAIQLKATEIKDDLLKRYESTEPNLLTHDEVNALKAFKKSPVSQSVQ